LNLFFVFSIFAALFKRSVLYQAFGFTKTQPILMGLLITFQYILLPYFEVKIKENFVLNIKSFSLRSFHLH
jgi:hypothetical protein